MKIAVCVKYVPVVAQIGFDYATKTIIREGVPSEINPFDCLGVLCALALKSTPADEVLVISMEPPQAREGLVYCLALGADRAMLLTDRALAGSDTLATARALALVLEKEKPESGAAMSPVRVKVNMPDRGPVQRRSQFPLQSVASSCL